MTQRLIKERAMPLATKVMMVCDAKNNKLHELGVDAAYVTHARIIAGGKKDIKDSLTKHRQAY